MWNVYIIKSLARKWYYVGSTNRIDQRIEEHNMGHVRSTKHYVPFALVYTKNFDSEKEARLYERRLKDCRRKKEALIRSFEKL